MKVRLLVLLAVFTLLPAAILSVFPSTVLSAQSSCPSGGNPPPGSTVNGGLDVDGTCILDDVTVNGGITVEATGHLEIQRGTVNGVIVTTAGTVCPPGSVSDADIWTAQIDGGISVSGTFPAARPFICGNEIRGGVTLTDIATVFGFFLGDPDAPAPGSAGCPGNTIHGTLHVTNSRNLEVESNIIGGSVLLSGSVLELNGNTINGSLRCSNGTIILPGEPPDTQGNTVRGANTCD